MHICIEAHDRRVPRADRCSVSDALLLKRTLLSPSQRCSGTCIHSSTIHKVLGGGAAAVVVVVWSGAGAGWLISQNENVPLFTIMCFFVTRAKPRKLPFLSVSVCL